MPRVLGYARVSSEEQARGTSLHDQQEAIRAYASSRRLTVARFYVEAESAVHEKIERREQIRTLLRDVRKGDLVLVDKLDRWSRDPEFTYRSVRELLAAGARFYAVGDAVDPSTPEGDTALGFRILFAREEHKRIRQRMVGTRELLRERGYWVEGVVPFGYRRPPPTRADRLAKNVLVLEATEAAVVRAIFDLYIRGRSMNQVAAEIHRPLYFVKRVLDRGRFYAGELEAKDGWVKGQHPAIITMRTHERARARADESRLGGVRVRADAETSTWIARDVARCARCGARMSAAYARRPRRGGTDYYYRCAHRCTSKGDRSNTGAHVRVEPVEETIAELVLERLEELRDELADEPSVEDRPAPVIALLEERRKRLARKRERYVEAHAADLISLEELRDKLRAVDEERVRLDAEEQRDEQIASPEIRAAVLREIRTLRKAWKDAPPTARRQIVNHLATAIAIRSDAPPVPHWRPLEDLLGK